MNFQSMEYFAAVAKNRSFTRAADALHITQQTLSAHIAGMQVEMWVALQMGNAFTVVNGRTTDDAMYIIALLDQKL